MCILPPLVVEAVRPTEARPLESRGSELGELNRGDPSEWPGYLPTSLHTANNGRTEHAWAPLKDESVKTVTDFLQLLHDTRSTKRITPCT